MRVAFLSHYASLYGANRSLLNLLDGLEGSGVKPFVIVGEPGDLVDELERRGVPNAVVKFHWWVSDRTPGAKAWVRQKVRPFYRSIANVRATREIVALLDEHKVDLVHSNSSVMAVGLYAARRRGCAHVWHVREFGDLDYAMYSDWPRWFHRKTMHESDRVVTVSNAVRDHFADWIDLERTTTIYNGVANRSEFEHAKQRRESTIRPDGPFTFALLGVVNSAKGQLEAITALAMVCEIQPNVRLLVVGLGGTDVLASHAERLGVATKVEYRGHVVDPAATYLEADTVLVCSPHEAMGRVTVEAMAAHCPVIGLDNGGTSELIEHGVTGLLYDGNERDLADRMIDVMQNNGAAQSRAATAWSQAIERFSVETYAAKMQHVFSAALDR